MKNTSSFSFTKVILTSLALVGVIYAIYTGIEEITRPKSFGYYTSSASSAASQPEKISNPISTESLPTGKGLKFLEMPVYPTDSLPKATNISFSYAEYQNKSKQETSDVFAAMREAGNGCFNQWPIGSYDESQIPSLAQSYLGGCTREQIINIAKTIDNTFPKLETVSGTQPYQLVEAAIKLLPADAIPSYIAEEMALARYYTTAGEYAELTAMFSNQCQGVSDNSTCDEVKKRIYYYSNNPDSAKMLNLIN